MSQKIIKELAEIIYPEESRQGTLIGSESAQAKIRYTIAALAEIRIDHTNSKYIWGKNTIETTQRVLKSLLED